MRYASINMLVLDYDGPAQGYRQFAFTVPQTIMTYSLGGLIPDNSLNLTANAICGIWAGQITRWDDPEIINVNPQLAAIQSLIAGKNITVRTFNGPMFLTIQKVFYRSDSTPGTPLVRRERVVAHRDRNIDLHRIDGAASVPAVEGCLRQHERHQHLRGLAAQHCGA